ncbi:glycosyl hydrolase [Frigoribacterium faeni]|uniref:glycosyl hydrolase n=1 Tax=Frigoribacterium faeni TaxID=145483 RepID=UPI001FB8DDF3|nr:glycosyl hydrolase [Frigoribacterium faeni]NIJ03769.1 outer membrane murein-binding lipoprotein Lpp [Frigoribacterium faeni]
MSESPQTFVAPLHVQSGAWWASSHGNARRTALGATATVVLLAMISWLIWISPTENPVRTAVQEVVGASPAQVATLKQDRSALLDQLVAAKEQLAESKTQLADVQQQAWTSEGQLTDAQARLASAQDALRDAEAATGGGGGSATGGGAGSSAAGGSGTGGGGGGSAAVSPGTSGDAGAGNGGGGQGSGGGAGAGDGDGTGGGSGGGSGGGATGPVPIQAPSLAEIVSPESRYFGLYTTQSPFSWSEFDDVSTKVGAQPNMAGYFQGFDQEFNATAVNRSWAKGDLPFLTWESRPIAAGNDAVVDPDYELSKIIDGDFDAYLTRWADALVANGLPMAIRLDHEMNGNWYPWAEGVNGNEKTEYVQMWQHVHDLFEARGANELVAWVWAPTRVEGVPTKNRSLEYTASLYPGDDYVDWVGMTGYLRNSPETPQSGDFRGTFGKTLDQLRQITTKPIVLAEMGAAELGTTGQAQKPRWIDSLFDELALPENDDIVGFSWFNLTATTVSSGSYLTNDWRIVSRRDSLEAFRTGIARTDTGFALRSSP